MSRPSGPIALPAESLPVYLALAHAHVLWRTSSGLVALANESAAPVLLPHILYGIPRRYPLIPIAGDWLDLRPGRWRIAPRTWLPGLRRHASRRDGPGLLARERDVCGVAWHVAAPSLDPRAYLAVPRRAPIDYDPPAPRVRALASGALLVTAPHPVTHAWRRLGRFVPAAGTDARDHMRHARELVALWWTREILPTLPPRAEPGPPP